jgi:hypothetical protein
MNDEELELQELLDLKGVINSELFKKYFSEPIYRELEELKNSYDCKTLVELNHTKGKYRGLKTFIDIVENIDKKIENKKIEVSDKA